MLVASVFVPLLFSKYIRDLPVSVAETGYQILLTPFYDLADSMKLSRLPVHSGKQDIMTLTCTLTSPFDLLNARGCPPWLS